MTQNLIVKFFFFFIYINKNILKLNNSIHSLQHQGQLLIIQGPRKIFVWGL